MRPHERQDARPPCPSPTPGVHSDSHPSSRWCHPAISSSVGPFSSFPQSLPASESFPMSQLFSWGGQSTRASALASFLPKKSQGWSPSEWTGWISFQSKGLSSFVQGTLSLGYCEVISYLLLCRSLCLTKPLSISLCPHSSLLGCGGQWMVPFLHRKGKYVSHEYCELLKARLKAIDGIKIRPQILHPDHCSFQKLTALDSCSLWGNDLNKFHSTSGLVIFVVLINGLS